MNNLSYPNPFTQTDFANLMWFSEKMVCELIVPFFNELEADIRSWNAHLVAHTKENFDILMCKGEAISKLDKIVSDRNIDLGISGVRKFQVANILLGIADSFK